MPGHQLTNVGVPLGGDHNPPSSLCAAKRAAPPAPWQARLGVGVGNVAILEGGDADVGSVWGGSDVPSGMRPGSRLRSASVGRRRAGWEPASLCDASRMAPPASSLTRPGVGVEQAENL